jgi:flagellar hook protein FlgE
MSLNTFSIGLSGLNANTEGLTVVGNNLANLNTVGFKGSNVTFSEVLGETLATGSVGLGVQVSSVRPSFTAGTVQSTNNPFDVAIQGKGFLILNDGTGNMYTRAGNLHLDKDNNLVADNDARVQGFLQDPATGKIDPNLGLQSIKLPSGLDAPITTSQLQAIMNLDANAPSGTKFTTSFQIYDSLGQTHTATINMQKEISATTPPVTRWRFDVTIPNKDVAGVAATNTQKRSLITGNVAVEPPAEGALLFDSTGKLVSAYLGADPATPPALADLTIPATGATMPTMATGGTLSPAIKWKLLTDTGAPAVSGYSNPSEVTFSSQNGASAGSLSSFSINPDGTISAVFTNGKNVNFAQIALAQFNNVDGLTTLGGGLYRESAASGSAFIGAPGESGRGRLLGGALEQSNVDLATELTKIITFQRGYQANAKIITVTDQIMQEAMNLKQ